MIVGIDFSIKSPAVTIIHEEEGTLFFSFPRKSVAKEDFFITLENNGVSVIALEDEPALPKTAKLTQREQSSIKDAFMEIDAIVGLLSEWTFTDEDYIAIEGFSFGSTGNRLAQISGYQWLLRARLITILGITPEQLYFFSPMTIKATAGNGHYKKDQMINALIQSDCDTQFVNAIRQAPAEFQNKKGAWLKPIDDIVDSYWIAKTLQKTLSTN